MVRFEEWVKNEGIEDPAQLEVARKAWDAALETMRKLIPAAAQTESTVGGLVMMLDVEIDDFIVGEE